MSVDKTAQGPSVVIVPGSEEATKDTAGITNPNLHRRIKDDRIVSAVEQAKGILSKDYRIGVYGNNSYRTTKINTHDEASTTSEVP